MKITGIDIVEYRQFKNIKFDFTYPVGHPKEGQPLDKVCFIGQSSTGKTTLLSLVHKFFVSIARGYNYIDNKRPTLQNDDELRYFIDLHEKISIKGLIDKDKSFEFSGKRDGKGHNIINWIDENEIVYYLSKQKKMCLYIPDSVASESEIILKKDENSERELPIKTNLQISFDNNKKKVNLEKLEKGKVLKLTNTNNSYIWQYLFGNILSYDNKVKQIAVDLINRSASFSAESLVSNINNWKKDNPNPRVALAEKCLNPILNKFFLEVDLDSSDAPLVLKTKNGKSIQSTYLSTGTKQIITTAIPTYILGKESITLLFDEPERSLFPDIQRGLIDYYTSLAPEAQFFFATHSPIIASAFEPCERFVLYFDENGAVKCHNGVAPEGDDPNDILRQDFGMADLMLEKGLEAYETYRHLAMQIRAETDEEKKNQLIAQRIELGNRYNFAGQYAPSK